MEMNEKDEIEGKASGIKIVMHDFESVFPKDDPSVIGNFINSMSVGLRPSMAHTLWGHKTHQSL